MSKKLFIKTWGCQMNVYDSSRMTDVVAPLGYHPTEELAEADLVILNTCHIREKATEKLFSELGRIRPHQQSKAANGGEMLLAVAGCVAQAEGTEIQRRAPYVDMVFGPQTYHQLPEMIAQVTRKAGKVLNTEFPLEAKFDHLPAEQTNTGVSAFLSVQEGCDKFCHFCVVPYTRGAEYSRPVKDIVTEAERLLAQGVREISLLGQNVNAYHGQTADGSSWNLARLFYRLAELPNLQRLRYTTSHPQDMDADLIKAHGAIPQLMPFLHLPVQSGSDAILAAMNRKHTGADYRRVIDALRTARPDIALSSDFIVGYPGESDADFADTMKLVSDIGFAQSFSFIYSKRPGTPAASLPNQVELKVAEERLQQLQTLLQQQQADYNRASVGKTLSVLIENPTRNASEPQLYGRTEYLQAVYIQQPSGVDPQRLVGQTLPVKMTSSVLNSLKGELATIAD